MHNIYFAIFLRSHSNPKYAYQIPPSIISGGTHRQRWPGYSFSTSYSTTYRNGYQSIHSYWKRKTNEVYPWGKLPCVNLNQAASFPGDRQIQEFGSGLMPFQDAIHRLNSTLTFFCTSIVCVSLRREWIWIKTLWAEREGGHFNKVNWMLKSILHYSKWQTTHLFIEK